MDWRSWAYGRLTEVGNPLLALLSAGDVHGGGSLEFVPKNKPFLVLRFGPKLRAHADGPYTSSLTVWIHDQPGSYKRIEDILPIVKARLDGPVSAEGATLCEWTGDSGDLADDGYKTITRNSSFNLVGTD